MNNWVNNIINQMSIGEQCTLHMEVMPPSLQPCHGYSLMRAWKTIKVLPRIPRIPTSDSHRPMKQSRKAVTSSEKVFRVEIQP